MDRIHDANSNVLYRLENKSINVSFIRNEDETPNSWNATIDTINVTISWTEILKEIASNNDLDIGKYIESVILSRLENA
ncbi:MULTISPECIES: hypothetical protein [unclassified Paenibacillus]|uniref:hypothetical protein n=1 Tax=unclassified Paenibacillus TaxID=185978 RepID=UPI0024063445|nr:MULTISPECIES: hypothetical protein [unclassified Paenibacillus]MDF9841777.1 aspartokinase-like uncharacterized kinase [Paenibacillus sp. PastF-2]MDF9848542.1 aspartokinase-like uncharacterized kinase [Paenibacillus sp. PastM-2]MDF9854936.1 aspartokinase-like uncharacterized kinase [Paenibacillus sp. PastF-1]MDH6480206.1 aspartokinase-like uncharacterized kinase [Paenibacillus sp. PastH-2]MDH6507810.1 aspartokinase-like uncharacterized kinase [Paenibacillus sp. PastM-3]